MKVWTAATLQVDRRPQSAVYVWIHRSLFSILNSRHNKKSVDSSLKTL